MSTKKEMSVQQQPNTCDWVGHRIKEDVTQFCASMASSTNRLMLKFPRFTHRILGSTGWFDIWF